jgi:hypothetical protein
MVSVPSQIPSIPAFSPATVCAAPAAIEIAAAQITALQPVRQSIRIARQLSQNRMPRSNHIPQQTSTQIQQTFQGQRSQSQTAKNQ